MIYSSYKYLRVFLSCRHNKMCSVVSLSSLSLHKVKMQNNGGDAFPFLLGFFIRPFYKMMLGKPIILKDMESVVRTLKTYQHLL